MGCNRTGLGQLVPVSQVKCWNPGTMSFERDIHRGMSWITDMCFMRNYSKLLTATLDRRLFLYDLTTGELAKCFIGQKYHQWDSRQAHSMVSALRFSSGPKKPKVPCTALHLLRVVH